MKNLRTYDSLGLADEDAVFTYLTSTFHDNLREWGYFVNWNKAFDNTAAHLPLIDKWDVLVSAADFDESFRALLSSNPELAETIPLLLVRDGSGTSQFSIVTETVTANWRLGIRHFDFSRPALTEADVELALEFVKKTGLVRIFQNGGVCSVRDYLLGAEAGLDSNARKNRGGDAMSSVVSRILSEHTDEIGGEFASEMNSAAIKAKWGIVIDNLNPGRRFDFVVNARGKLLAIEVNAYGGGGSKLKATAGEYEGLQKEMRGTPLTFAWITEGAGWKTARRPLRKAFGAIDYLLNLRLIEDGALREILGQG